MKKRANLREITGYKQVVEKDPVDRASNAQGTVPHRRYIESDRYESLDKFSPGMDSFAGDPGSLDWDDTDGDGEDPLNNDVESYSFVNSQLDLNRDIPSTMDVHRFNAQNRQDEGDDDNG